jgi:hypothetical protein
MTSRSSGSHRGQVPFPACVELFRRACANLDIAILRIAPRPMAVPSCVATAQRLTWAVARVRLGIFVMNVSTIETSAMMPMVV